MKSSYNMTEICKDRKLLTAMFDSKAVTLAETINKHTSWVYQHIYSLPYSDWRPWNNPFSSHHFFKHSIEFNLLALENSPNLKKYILSLITNIMTRKIQFLFDNNAIINLFLPNYIWVTLMSNYITKNMPSIKLESNQLKLTLTQSIDAKENATAEPLNIAVSEQGFISKHNDGISLILNKNK